MRVDKMRVLEGELVGKLKFWDGEKFSTVAMPVLI